MANTLAITQDIDIIPLQNERSERTVLLEQLRYWYDIDKQAGNAIARIKKRVAELDAIKAKEEAAA